MSRQSISFTEPNDKWLKQKVGTDGEYKSNSEAVNDLIRKARKEQDEIEYIRARLIASEKSVQKSGWVDKDKDQILAGIKDRLRADGEL
ncbi:ribbon-helix-helix domain-containing protein [Nitrospira sp. M1]